jgi:hypothetical protein
MSLLIAAAAYTFRVTPDSHAPGAAGIQHAINVFAVYALMAAAAGFLLGAATWAIGGRVGNEFTAARRSRSPGSKRRFCCRYVATLSHAARGARVHEGYTRLTPRVAVSCRPQTGSSGFAGCSTTRPNYRQLRSCR